MNVIQPDHSLWKIVFGFMFLVAGLVFVGALALSDADIFNRERARAEAAQIDGRTAYESQKGQMELEYYPQLALEKTLAQINIIRAQTDRDAAAIAETTRMTRAENDRMLAARVRFDLIKSVLVIVAGGGVVVVALYALLLVTHRTVDRLLPRRGVVVAEPAPAARAAADPWRDPAFKAEMRQQARRRERQERAAAMAARRPANGNAAGGNGASGNGTHGNGAHGNGAHGDPPHRPAREPRPVA